MIWNVVDRRSNKYNVNIDAVFEPSYHDNCVDNSSQAEVDDSFTICCVNKISIAEAINIADTTWECQVTLYMYDYDSNPLGY